MIGPWKGLDGKVHDATGKAFDLEFCTVCERRALRIRAPVSGQRAGPTAQALSRWRRRRRTIRAR